MVERSGVVNLRAACTNCRRKLGQVMQLCYPDGSNGCLGHKRAAQATGCSQLEAAAGRRPRLAIRDLPRAEHRAELAAAGHGPVLVRLKAQRPQSPTVSGSETHISLGAIRDGSDWTLPNVAAPVGQEQP